MAVFLFCGCFWFAYKGMWGWAVISFALAVMTAGLSWLVFPLFANEHYAKSLVKSGYLTEAQAKAKARTSLLARRPRHQRPSMADELGKLPSLRITGVLTEQELAAQKARLLNPR